MKENKKFITAEEALLNKTEPLYSADEQSHKSFNHKRALCVIIIVACLVVLVVGTLFSSEVNQVNTAKKEQANSPAVTQKLSQGNNSDNFLQLENYKSSINDGEIFFTKEGKLFVLETTTMKVTNFPIGDFKYFSDISFSHNGQYLFVNADNYILIYNLQNKKLVKIEADMEKIGPASRVEGKYVSPTNEYFIIITSCCPGDVGRGIYDFNGNRIKQLYGGEVKWSPEGTKFAMSIGEIELSILPLGPTPKNSSIYLEEITGKEVKQKLLVKATNQSSFTPLEWIESSTLIYKEERYSKPFPETPTTEDLDEEMNSNEWGKIYDNPVYVYWKLDIVTGKKEKIEFVETQDMNVVSHSLSRKWKIITDVEDSKLVYYIVKSDNSAKIKLDVQQAVWKPAFHASSYTYKIINGSMYRMSRSGEQELFIDKYSLKESEGDYREIANFELSPDKSKMLLQVEGGLTPYLLYYVDIKTGKSTYVYPSVESVWSPDSRYIAFTLPPADVGPRMLYVFDTFTNDFVETNKTNNKFISYSDLRWTTDSLAINAKYETLDDIPNGNIVDKGEIQIKLK